ncbi:MAG: HAMP domain-containing histidine kinase [Oscillospiraceae bacterium]|nr:HAMP domain-containing histidine kinase [Oscillospiraceae bacterium]
MRNFNRIFALIIVVILILFAVSNIMAIKLCRQENGRGYRVEIHRLIKNIEDNGYEDLDLSDCLYVKDVVKKSGDDFYKSESDYYIWELDGQLYRFEYENISDSITKKVLTVINGVLVIVLLIIVLIYIYIRHKILMPFEKLTDVPYQLSKGNLTVPLKESKNKFFGKFIWGVDLLRENIQQQKERELELQKNRKMLLLSLSHDIKTPLSAIKLYSKALSKNLYNDTKKQIEIAENINSKADEIERYVTQIITASREEILAFDMNIDEFYLSDLVNKVDNYYTEKLELNKIKFIKEGYNDCLIYGDIDRSVEVLQNIIENAIKYGDGDFIRLSFSEEDGCILISVCNSGCTLKNEELPHIFDSFWRGENSTGQKGNGLGLYICRSLMNKMNGDIFAHIEDGNITVTGVFAKV